MQTDRYIRRRLKLRDLDTLLAVSQSGSMAKAARRLSVSQPAISKAIAELEHTLGVPIFDRTAKGVEPTGYGRALIKWSNVVFDDMRQGIEEIAFLTDPGTGELRIGATEPMIGGILPAIIGRLSRQYPRMAFEVVPYGAMEQQKRDLRERRIDLTLGRILEPNTDEDFRAEILFDEPLFVVAGNNNPWAKRRTIKLTDLANEPWTLPRTDTVVGHMVVEAFRASGLEIPDSGVICNSIQMHCSLLATGRYLAMLPRSLLTFGKLDTLKVLPIDLKVKAIPVGVSILRNRMISPIAQLFIDCAGEVAKPLTDKSKLRARSRAKA
jgi:DNA-binding transcriptional LysR family regulator